ncbi:MAG: nucleotide sugar dehydrogenase [Elusimicrobia bacterium]|nr:nucleotide sugar dehydrogenase [Elusimicrobiota bacterium]
MSPAIEKPKVAIFGLGYVGLTMGTVLADLGFTVLGVEPRKRNVRNLRKGIAPIHEKGLTEMLKKHINRRFKVFDGPREARADIYVVAVGTPVDSADKVPNLEYIESAAESIGRLIRQGNLALLRSTVPVGTTRDVFIPIVERVSGLKAGRDFSVVFAPERTSEGSALTELRFLPQIIGGVDDASVTKAARFFRFMTPQIIPVSSLEAAELVKLFNNCYRDVIFGFANEVALICDGFNLDPVEIIGASNKDYPRSSMPYPSPGVGGYCLTKDPFILLHSAKEIAFKPYIVFHGRRVNSLMPSHAVTKVKRFLTKIARKPPSQATVGILGFAYKGHPETADIRFSPTMDVTALLGQAGIKKIIGHDPIVDPAEIRRLGIQYSRNVAGCFKGADAVIVMTNHASYRNRSLLNHLFLMNKPGLFFDPWQMHARQEIMRRPGLHYSNLGFDSFR